MGNINIIGDVHGDYGALMTLVNIMPKAPFLSVGDMIDRGPESLEVMRFFMQPGNKAILGNHEHLMLDAYHARRRKYVPGVWLHPKNGGLMTLRSFNRDLIDGWLHIYQGTGKVATIDDCLKFIRKQKNDIFPEDVMEWVDTLPVYYEEEGLFVSHAPRCPEVRWKDLLSSKTERVKKSPPPSNLLWNAGTPGYISGITQIHGHLIFPNPIYYRDDEKGIYGIGIDTYRGRGSVLTGLSWPSMKIYQVLCHQEGTTQNIVEEASPTM